MNRSGFPNWRSLIQAVCRVDVGNEDDYSVMENTAKAAMVTIDMSWSELGNWQAVHAARIRDKNGNTIIARAELVDRRNVLAESDEAHASLTSPTFFSQIEG